MNSRICKKHGLLTPEMTRPYRHASNGKIYLHCKLCGKEYNQKPARKAREKERHRQYGLREKQALIKIEQQMPAKNKYKCVKHGWVEDKDVYTRKNIKLKNGNAGRECRICQRLRDLKRGRGITKIIKKELSEKYSLPIVNDFALKAKEAQLKMANLFKTKERKTI